MPKFPTRQADILALASQMLAGYQSHAADFPSIGWFALNLRRIRYRNTKKIQGDAFSQSYLASRTKNISLKKLIETMKACLRKSEVDVANNPEKLALISWGPKSAPQPIASPGQPTNLHPVAEGQGMLWLAWDSPATDSGGPVRNYIIERREQPTGGEFGAWNIVGTALNNEINLTDQPRGIQLEYRVKAINTSGESMPSNTVPVVL